MKPAALVGQEYCRGHEARTQVLHRLMSTQGLEAPRSGEMDHTCSNATIVKICGLHNIRCPLVITNSDILIYHGNLVKHQPLPQLAKGPVHDLAGKNDGRRTNG
jgi:hypothetical protein